MMRVETVGLVPRASVVTLGAREGKKAGKVSEEEECSTTSSSSIGRNSDATSERSTVENESGENEVQSAYNGPLHAMEALEEVLPIRRGISNYYNGKSKSFTSLVDATTSQSSMKDIVKPENAYTRRRRNLMAFNHVWDKNKNSLLRSNSVGICKRTTISSSRSSLALAFAMNNSESSSSITSEDSTCSSNSPLPPLHPNRGSSSSGGAGLLSSHLQDNFSAWRSFSMVDLQHCAIAATMNMSNSSSHGNETVHPS